MVKIRKSVLILLLIVMTCITTTSVVFINKYNIAKNNIKVLNTRLEQVKAENVNLKSTIRDFGK